MKKYLSFFVSFVLVLSVLCIPAYAVDDVQITAILEEITADVQADIGLTSVFSEENQITPFAEYCCIPNGGIRTDTSETHYKLGGGSTCYIYTYQHKICTVCGSTISTTLVSTTAHPMH